MFQTNSLGNATASAGTVIYAVVPPNTSYRTLVTRIRYTPGATAHTLTISRPMAQTSTSAAAASGQAVISLKESPASIAANDIIAFKRTDNVTEFGKVNSVSGLDVTLTANIAGNVALGAPVWNFGVPGDTDPVTGLTHPALATTANTTLDLHDPVGSIFSSHKANQPVLLQSNNATNAGAFNLISFGYSKE